MATIIGGLTTSHIPAVGNAIAKKLYDDPYWKPFFDGYTLRSSVTPRPCMMG